MDLSKKMLEDLKQIELDILREFVEVCEQLDLRYYLLGGTLLGAVRHQGFIPWDDDIDVGMPREDYDIFVRKAQKMLPSHLFIQTIETDPGYVNCFAKIRNSDTTFIESSAVHMRINHGVFMDVFPLDYYPEDAQEQIKLDSRKKWLLRRIGVEFKLSAYNTPKGRAKKRIIKMLYPSVSAAIKKREQLYRSTPHSGLMANHGGAWGKKEIIPTSWYGDGTTVTFEGMRLRAPAEYDKWLTQVYGDYMQLPPVEKRVGHHYVDVVDFGKSYKEYTEKAK